MNGILGACGSFGLAALPYLLLEPAMASDFGWRALFVVGSLPLVATPFLLIWLRETKTWLASRDSQRRPRSMMSELQGLTHANCRRNTITMSLLWLVINFSTASSALFFTQYAVTERFWQPADFTLLSFFGLGGAFLGYLLAGVAMDVIGRRWTITIFMALLGIFTQICYQAEGWWTVALSFVALQAMLGVWVSAYTLNSELFPTDLRAAANGWCHNLIGRWGVVVAPWIRALVEPIGSVGDAATLLAFVAYLAIPIVWLGIPETKNSKL